MADKLFLTSLCAVLGAVTITACALSSANNDSERTAVVAIPDRNVNSTAVMDAGVDLAPGVWTQGGNFWSGGR